MDKPRTPDGRFKHYKSDKGVKHMTVKHPSRKKPYKITRCGSCGFIKQKGKECSTCGA